MSVLVRIGRVVMSVLVRIGRVVMSVLVRIGRVVMSVPVRISLVRIGRVVMSVLVRIGRVVMSVLVRIGRVVMSVLVRIGRVVMSVLVRIGRVVMSVRRSDRPRSDERPRSDRPRSDERPRSDRPRSDERPRSDGPRSDSYQGRDARDEDSRESRGPWIPEEIIFEDLDKSVRFELQTLPESLQERVGRHLLAAEVALGQDDLESALEHSRQAKKLAGRVAVVREANGTIEYLAGEYSAALNELRAVRRMTGNSDFVAIMADCERGLGRPEKAIEFLKSIPASQMSPETRIEALIVSAGARADMGQVDAALLMLNVGALTSLPPGDLRARMQEAYSVLLEQAGRAGEVQKWRSRAIKSDINGVTALVRNQESEITAHVIEESD